MTNQTNKSTINHLDDMSFSSVQVIAWSCALATEAVVIVVGNLLTIVLFAFNKKLRSKKSLYLVLNMAKYPWFSFHSFPPAILKPGGSEFFPVFILRVCTSNHVNHQWPQFWCLEKDSATNCSSFSSPEPVVSRSRVRGTRVGYKLSRVALGTRMTVPHHQNRVLQRRRLTKTLLLVSLIAMGSWLPPLVYSLIAFLG